MFSQLPDELNEQILSFIELDSKATLRSICLTNKTANRLATPLFYSHVDVVGNKFDADNDRDIIRLGRLCQTLVEDPPRCAYVKTIRLAITRDDKDFRIVDYLKFNTQQCEQGLTGLSNDVRHTISTYLRSEETNMEPLPRATLGGLLLAMCHQARVLQLEGDPNMIGESLLKTIILQMSTQPPILALQDVTLPCGAGQTISVPGLVPILRLPSLRKLNLHNFVLHPQSFAPGLTANVRSSLQELNLTYCTFDILDFAPLLLCCPNLRLLWIEWYNRDDNFWRMDWPALGGAVRRLASLESLRLEHRHDMSMTVASREANGLVPPGMEVNHILPMGSIKSLQRLREIIVPSLALFGSDGFRTDNLDNEQSEVLSTLLPASLQELTLLYEDIYLAGTIRLLPLDPMVARLDDFVLYNCQKDRWITKDGVEGFVPVPVPDLTGTAPRSMLNNIPLLIENLRDSLGLLPPAMRSAVLDQWHREAGEELPLGECMIMRAALQEVRSIFRL
ncbi:hypothetical protein CB0940_06959 [Cercospora beticola]|uniref:F-box domain-containing protein n=1 Tax=Cercospora beticola TaxID=122368 RepID=A0A2G5H870_CERBT|nr:hypothetical protein CB0940_06959 [Cercospora beticola]PIA88730.1 hypothetical protein CB0940_06959 [Cercospora beticola]WPB02877.1 hypothetical protein RHO25_007513 [Cercospora beticola]CAK1358428.1 unnamed protein product [Cercospora beticola]